MQSRNRLGVVGFRISGSGSGVTALNLAASSDAHASRL